IPGVAVAGVTRGIDVVHYAVEGGRLTVAHVSPVASEATADIGIHTDEVGVYAAIHPTGTVEVRARVGVGPSDAAVCGPEEEDGTGANEPAVRPFVHAGNVHIACDQVARDLDVADERGAAAHIYRAAPSGTAVSGVGTEDVPVR